MRAPFLRPLAATLLVAAALTPAFAQTPRGSAASCRTAIQCTRKSGAAVQ